jgi:TonB family protein
MKERKFMVPSSVKFFIKNISALIVFVLASWNSAVSELPDMGRVKNGIYTNQFFAMTWELPKNWEVRNGSGVNAGNSRNYALLHLVAITGERESVDVLAEDNTRISGFSLDYEKRLKELLVQRGWQPVGNVVQQPIGVDLYLNFEKFKSGQNAVTYSAFAVTALRGYELKFIVSAGSEERLDALIHDVVRLQIRPDWISPESSTAPASSGMPTKVDESDFAKNHLIHKVSPIYPFSARQSGVEGTVVMTGIIDTEGRFKYLYVIEGDPLFSKAAVDAVSQWRYQPYFLVDGKPIEVRTHITVHFTLQRR